MTRLKASFSKMGIFKRIFLSVCLFLLPLAIVFYFALTQVAESVTFGRLEQAGLRFQRPLLRLVKAAGEYRLYTVMGAADKAAASRQEVESLLLEVDAIQKADGEALQFTAAALAAANLTEDSLAAVNRHWQALREAASGPPGGAKRASSLDSSGEYDAFMNSVRGMVSHAGDTSNLTLDPELDTYYLADVASVVGGQTLQRIASATQFMGPLLRSGQLSLADGKQMAVFGAALKESDFDRITGDLDIALSENKKAARGASPTLKAALDGSLTAYKASVQRVLSMLGEKDGHLPGREDWQAAALQASASSLDLCDKVNGELAAVLEQRLDVFSRNRWLMILGTFATLGMLLFVITAVLRGITNPLTMAVEHLNRVAQGDISGELPAHFQARGDEIGALATALSKMSGGLRQMIQEIASGVAVLSSMATGLETNSAQMAAGSAHASDKAHAVAAAAEQMSSNAISVATGVEQTTTNLAHVASATGQMTRTIGEIAANSEKARGIASEASAQAASITAQIAQLGEATQAIGKVSETIMEISSQTNLLALNATIEAARAGAAGKGFAVVANEIKTLAQQTAAATEDIKRRIGGVQTSTSEGISEIAKITHVIEDVSAIVNSIASAIDHQAGAAKDIARKIDEASIGVTEANTRVAETSQVTREIARDISEVERVAREISAGSGSLRRDAGELAAVSGRLTTAIGRFHL